MRSTKTWLLASLFAWCSCQQSGSEPGQHPPSSGPDSLESAPARSESRVFRNGKIRQQPVFPTLFLPARLDSFDIPVIRQDLLTGLEQQLDVLEQSNASRNYRIGNLQFDIAQLEETVRILQSRQHTKPLDLHHLLDAHQIWGADRRGHVLFTGYFTPVIPVSKTPSGPFRFPIYDRPRDWTGPMPTRAEIEGEGVLDNQGLELAYASSRVDIYYMQLQGSGFVEFPDGTRKLLSYNGTNRHPYRSIEKYLLSRDDLAVPNVSITGVKTFLSQNPELCDSVLFHNPSYTFFKARFAQPRGAGNVPLQGGLSVAVDQRYLPLGSCLLAAIPVYDKRQNRVTGHEYRFLLAQDVGGRIKGPGHVDLYFGTGKEARAQAMRMKSYGRLWLLLPKANSKLITMRLNQ